MAAELIGAVRGQDGLGTILLGPRSFNNARFLGELSVPDSERNLIVGTGRPLFLAEFGTTAHADHASRVRWTRFNRQLAETRGIPWGVWSLAPTFAIYDLAARTFDPDLLAALMD